MPVQTPPESERQAPQSLTEPEGEGAVRALAVERIHRIRRFKLHLIVFAVAIPALTGLWVLTEYYGPIGRYIRRRMTQAEVAREVQRLKSRR
jgi:hypothetical protein